jgi:hypothetical protein
VNLSRTLGRAFRGALPILLILGVAWISRYLHFREFGLYEDDWTIVPGAAAMSAAELVRHVSAYLIHLYGHGRPLSDSLIYLSSWLGWKLGGLTWMYRLGFAFVGLNCILIYQLARRVAGAQVALLAGLAFAVFPADTSQAYLTHSLGLQPSLSLALLSIHAYLSRREWATYLLAALVLFTYETPFGLIAGAPLLAPGAWDRQRLRRLSLHGLVLGVILGAVLGVRFAISDDRVGGVPFPWIFLTPVVHMVEGPLVSLGMFFYRPITAILLNDLTGWAVVALAFAVLAGCLLAWAPSAAELSAGDLRSILRLAPPRAKWWRGWRERWGSVSQAVRDRIRLAAAAVLMLVLAYPLTYTVRAYAIDGRDTRVHFAAAAGASLLVAVVASAAWDALRERGLGRLGALLLAAELALLIGFGQVIQEDYRAGWINQQRFWSRLIAQIPDVRDGTVVLVEAGPLGDVTQIGANTWNLSSVLEQLYVFPEAWKTDPRVLRLQPAWREHILAGEGPLNLYWESVLSSSSVWSEIEGKDVILFLDESGELVRQSGPMDIAGQMTSLMTTEERGEPPYPHRLFYNLLITETAQDGAG